MHHHGMAYDNAPEQPRICRSTPSVLVCALTDGRFSNRCASPKHVSPRARRRQFGDRIERSENQRRHHLMGETQMSDTSFQPTLRPPVMGHPILNALAENWWLFLLRGIAAIIFGILAFVWPGLTLLTLIFLWGAYAIADGIFALWAAISGRVSMAPRWWLAIVGVAGIIAGVLAFAWP